MASTAYPVRLAAHGAGAAEAAGTARLLSELCGAENVVTISVRRGDQTIDLPVSSELFPTITAFLALIGRYGSIDVAPIEAIVSTQQAADILNMSRPHLVKLLETGALPFHRVGTHRRVLLDDVMAYKQAHHVRAISALKEMAKIDRELGAS